MIPDLRFSPTAAVKNLVYIGPELVYNYICKVQNMSGEGLMSLNKEFLRIKREYLEKEYSHLNERQREAVFNVKGPLLVLAGAGSGKTTVLVNRIAYLIKYGNAYYEDSRDGGITADDIDYLKKNRDFSDRRAREIIAENPCQPSRILAITFTNKAAEELEQRLSTLAEGGSEVWASTFHSACVRILRGSIAGLGYSSNFTIYDTADKNQLLKNILKELGFDEKLISPREIGNVISRAKDRLLTAGEYEQTANDYITRLYANIYKEYEKRLRLANAVDFDDLIMLTAKLLENDRQVREYYCNRFDYILVDEYQDTNIAQYRLVSLLAGQHRNLCVVGDDDQSIYKFRGATIENILKFEDQYPDAKIIRLEQNYRSTQVILDAANSIIGNNIGRKGKVLWTDKKGGELIEVYQASNESDEAEYIAESVLELVRNGSRFCDCCVLYRMNTQSSIIENAFVKSGIPYRVIGGLRFFEHKEIKDIIAYLCLINNPNDDIRLRRIINIPKRGIGDTTLTKAAEIAAALGESIFTVISRAESFPQLSSKARELKSFTSMILELHNRATDTSPGRLLGMLLEKSGYIRMLEASGESEAARIENIKELVSNITIYEQQNEDATLEGFLEEVALMTDIDNYDENSDSAVLMTMHSAKGLEFPNVFIAGVEDEIFPSDRCSGQEEIEEERRLAYVGVTRAKQRLVISAASRRMLYGKTSFHSPSRFIDEIPEELKVYKKGIGYFDDFDFGRSVGSFTSNRTKAYGYSKAASKGTLSDSFTAVGVTAPNADISFKTGEKVIHKVFGKGEIRRITPMGNDNLLEIAFDKVGMKKIMANFAKLEKITE